MKRSNVYFTVGPSQVFPSYKKHLLNAVEANIPSLSHRSDAFHTIFNDTVSSLREILTIPKDYHVFFLSSATEAMERIVQNCVSKKSYHYIDGAFSRLFQITAQAYGKQAAFMEVRPGLGFTNDYIRVPRGTELACVTQNETSTGVSLPPSFLGELKRRYPKTLVAVDVVSSVPGVKTNITDADCVFFSVQKGFGLPAGLAVLIVSPRAMEKAQYLEKKHEIVGGFHRFSNLSAYAQKGEVPETPNVLSIYLLGKIAEDMKRTGMQIIREQTKEKAQLLYSYFDTNKNYTLFVKDGMFRSNTTLVVEVAGGSEKLVKYLAGKGFIVGRGYKEHKNTHIRIANFPSHTLEDVKSLKTELDKASQYFY